MRSSLPVTLALAFGLGLALALPGCFSADPPAEDAPATSNGTITVDEQRPDPTFEEIPDAKLGSLAAPDTEATLDAPPELVPGEWWRIAFSSGITGETVQFVRVVAKRDGDVYVVGMPHEGWNKEAVIYHVPFFGDVNLDLSGHAHDVPFLPLKFPLTEGATWVTHFEFEQQDLTANVALDSPTVARITYEGRQCGIQSLLGPCPEDSPVGEVMSVVYDASIHEIRSWSHAAGHSYEVLEHGYGFEGWVTVPRGEDLVFLNGRIAASAVDMGLQPALPIETVLVDGGFNRVSFIIGAGTITGTPGGAFRETATAPDGTAYVHESIPGSPIAFTFLEHKDPDGDWQLEHLAAGPGYAFIEGIAYHQYDIHVPSGDVRTDHSHEVVR